MLYCTDKDFCMFLLSYAKIMSRQSYIRLSWKGLPGKNISLLLKIFKLQFLEFL